jgi:putative membrane protein
MTHSSEPRLSGHGGDGDEPAGPSDAVGAAADRGEAGDSPPWLEPEGLGGQLHPGAIGVWSLQMLGAMAVVAIVRPEAVVGLLAVAALLLAVNGMRWKRFRWRLGDGTLIITQGVIQRHRRVIPLERIQSVDVVRRLSHRLFRVEALHVEAVGGSDTEGQLDALQPAMARQVRAALLAGRDAGPAGQRPGEPAQPAGADTAAAAAIDASATPSDARHGGALDDEGHELARVGPGQLLRAGVTEANVTVLAAAAGFGWNLVSDRVDEYAQRLPMSVGPTAAIAAVVVGLLVVAVLLVLGQLITYWDFRLTRTEREVRIRRGLLEQRFDTIPLRRIQALRIEENVPRRLLGYAAVKADVAGKPGGGSTGTDTLLPFGTAAGARELVATILDDPDAPQVPLVAMPRRARTRRRVRAVLATALATAAAAGVWGMPGLFAAVLLIPAVATADASYRALGWARDHGLLVARAGWWTRRTAFVPEHRLQTPARRATLLQRWRRLATVELSIARSPGLWSGPRWIDLDAETADARIVELAQLLPTTTWGGQPVPTSATSRFPG